MTLQSDGKIVIGGYFSRVNGIIRNGVARLNPDGSVDAGFSPPAFEYRTVPCDFCSGVQAVAIQADGKVLAGGHFTHVGGVARRGMARLNADGKLDPEFTPNSAAFQTTYSAMTTFAIQPDGKIIAAGYEVARIDSGLINIARFHPNGSLDASFSPNGPDDYIHAVLLDPTGKIYIGHNGEHVWPEGVRRDFLARLNADGSLDASFTAGSGPLGTV